MEDKTPNNITDGSWPVPEEHRFSEQTHPASELPLSKTDENPYFFESYTEQQHEISPFNQGNRFFKKSEGAFEEQRISLWKVGLANNFQTKSIDEKL